MTASDPTADAGRIKFTFEVKDFSGNTEAIDDITVSNRDGRQLGRKVITHNGLYTISVDRQEIIENDKMHIIVASAASAKIELEQNGLIYELIESPDS